MTAEMNRPVMSRFSAIDIKYYTVQELRNAMQCCWRFKSWDAVPLGQW